MVMSANKNFRKFKLMATGIKIVKEKKNEWK